MKFVCFGEILLCAVVFIVPACVPLVGYSTETAEIQGRVTDDSGHPVRVPRAVISLDGEHQKYETRSDSAGQYSIDVLPGKYKVLVSYPGYCDLQRGSFLVNAKSLIQIDFHLMNCLSDSDDGKYNYVELNRVPNSDVRPLVLFGNSSAKRDKTEFAGPILPIILNGILTQKQHKVVFTYNLLTIRCDILTYDAATRRVIGTGDVEVESASKTRLGNRVVVELEGLDPQTTIGEKF